MTDGRRKPVVRRLESGADLRLTLDEIIKEHDLAAGVIISLVGSLQVAHLRLAGAESTARLEGPLEIVSATGTVGSSGLHVHISVADKLGTVTGGHLLSGCITASTIELVVDDLSDWWTFERKADPATGYTELSAVPARHSCH